MFGEVFFDCPFDVGVGSDNVFLVKGRHDDLTDTPRGSYPNLLVGNKIKGDDVTFTCPR